jgi:hypothetical protein
MARKSIVYASLIMIIAAGVLLGAYTLKSISLPVLPSNSPPQAPPVQTLATQIPTAIQTLTATPTTATATPELQAPALETGSGLKTCAEQGGTVVTAGQITNGTWLDASDTFSCSSNKPITAVANQTASVALFNLTIDQNDDLGTIVP